MLFGASLECLMYKIRTCLADLSSFFSQRGGGRAWVFLVVFGAH